MTFIDPPPPPEHGNILKAKDLIGTPVILQPTGFGEWPAKEDGTGAQRYIACNAWAFDRAGITAEATDVRISWWKAVGQLEPHVGEYVACKPVQGDDRSVTLIALEGDARTVAEKIVAELAAGGLADGEEPF